MLSISHFGKPATTTNDLCASGFCQNDADCVLLKSNEAYFPICKCKSGFEGPLCEIRIDSCRGNQCMNGSWCIEGSDSYSCTCREGWEGIYCENNIDECAANPCENGSCIDGINEFTCRCDSGWEGDRCDINVDDCTNNPCNNGKCYDEVDSYSCECHPGWKGDHCTEISGICESEPCQNNGACSKIVDDFNCECPSSWQGIFCTFKKSTNDFSAKKEDKGIATPQIGPYGPSQLIKGPCQDHKQAQLNGVCRDIPTNDFTKCGVVSDKENNIGLLKSRTSWQKIVKMKNQKVSRTSITINIIFSASPDK